MLRNESKHHQQQQGMHLGVRESGKPSEEGESEHSRRGGHEYGVHAACFRDSRRRCRPVVRHSADEAPLTTGVGYRGEGRKGGEVDGAVEEEAEPLHLQEMARRRVVATAAAAAAGGQAGLRGCARWSGSKYLA